jgi:hypothetical protein
MLTSSSGPGNALAGATTEEHPSEWLRPFDLKKSVKVTLHTILSNCLFVAH